MQSYEMVYDETERMSSRQRLYTGIYDECCRKQSIEGRSRERKRKRVIGLIKVEMFAQSLVPAVPLQYLAIGFSTDKIMVRYSLSTCDL